MNLLKENGMTSASSKMVITFCMLVKNRRRLVAALGSLNPTIRSNEIVADAIKFINTSCSDTTRELKLMPTVKIPDSFPEICAIIYITDIISTSNTNTTTIANMLVAKLWAASLAFHPDVQEINRRATEAEWNRWGAGGRTNRNEEVIRFNPEIYQNAANDKIQLVNPTGANVIIPEGGYKMTDIEAWVTSWYNHIRGAPMITM